MSDALRYPIHLQKIYATLAEAGEKCDGNDAAVLAEAVRNLNTSSIIRALPRKFIVSSGRCSVMPMDVLPVRFTRDGDGRAFDVIKSWVDGYIQGHDCQASLFIAVFTDLNGPIDRGYPRIRRSYEGYLSFHFEAGGDSSDGSDGSDVEEDGGDASSSWSAPCIEDVSGCVCYATEILTNDDSEVVLNVEAIRRFVHVGEAAASTCDVDGTSSVVTATYHGISVSSNSFSFATVKLKPEQLPKSLQSMKSSISKRMTDDFFNVATRGRFQRMRSRCLDVSEYIENIKRCYFHDDVDVTEGASSAATLKLSSLRESLPLILSHPTPYQPYLLSKFLPVMSHKKRSYLLNEDDARMRFKKVVEEMEHVEGFKFSELISISVNVPEAAIIKCVNCATSITSYSNVIQESQKTYLNPHSVHHTLTLSTSMDCDFQGDAVYEDSWFPGYGWIIATCKTCTRHLGWKFFKDRNYIGVRAFEYDTFFALTNASISS